MKKLLLVISLFGISLAFGLLFFESFAPSTTSSKKNIVTTNYFAKPPSQKNNVIKKSKLKAPPKEGYELDDYRKDLNEFIDKKAREVDSLCKKKFTELDLGKEYLDPSSSILKDDRVQEKIISFIIDLNNTSSDGYIADYSIEKIMTFDDWDPLEIKMKMSQSVVCLDVDYTNLTHSLINSLKKIEIDKEKIIDRTRLLVFASMLFAGNREPIEYKFYSMEILFGLLDNELIDRKNAEELTFLREQVIRTVQNFENDFSEKNDKRTNQEILRAYADSNNDIGQRINEIIENITNELPEDTWREQ